ncbi:hypothetical protein [Flavobacterium sp.]|uniref:hypothetical protein n=1 Tax=Flavobacterium sp. TaxID=239 RepID=UPI0037BFA0B9
MKKSEPLLWSKFNDNKEDICPLCFYNYLIMSYDKLQIRVCVNDSDHLKNISLLNVEVGYPNSTNQTVWKSNARIFTEEKILDTMKQATWKTFDKNSETFVFDFLISKSKQIVVKQTTITSKDNSLHTIENKIDIDKETTSLEFLTIQIVKTTI